MKWIATLGLLILCLLALPGRAELYKWVDADGKVHYSDQPPPPDAREQKALSPPHAAAHGPGPAAPGKSAVAPSTAPKSTAEQEMEFRKRRVEAAEAEAKRQHEAQASAEKQRNCDQARNRVAMLQTGGRITKAGPNGEQIYLGDSEIAAELVEARKIADSWCK